MEAQTKQKEFKVRLHHTDPGNCLEVWELTTSKEASRIYVGRDDYGDHTWYTLCDAPDGFCERNYRVIQSVVFVICDAQWQPLGLDSNDRERFPKCYPTLEEVCQNAWDGIKQRFKVTSDGFDDWIASQAPAAMSTTERINWRRCQNETTECEILCRFDYLGDPLAIFRLRKRHTECDARWSEYFAGSTDAANNDGYLRFYGYEYDR